MKHVSDVDIRNSNRRLIALLALIMVVVALFGLTASFSVSLPYGEDAEMGLIGGLIAPRS